MFEPMVDDWDILPGQSGPEGAESMALWRYGLFEDPIDERDYRAAEEAEHYSDLACLARKSRSDENQEFMNADWEDVNEL